ncbi:hypothetical protein HZC34_04655 [Candidatus Saganbacteria bacterium]|nr:hypothetical protein [Candidatus Saganbacteria bacterium]
MKKIILILIIFGWWAAPAFADEALTKGEAISRLSATDFIKNKIGDLFSWTIGYDLSRVNRIKLVPNIKYIKAIPRSIPPDGRSVLEISAGVEDPMGLPNLSGVRADLSSIGRLSNTILVDNGLWGDRVANDGIYSLQSNIDPSVQVGNKEIPVAAANKQGWLAVTKTTIIVRSPSEEAK